MKILLVSDFIPPQMHGISVRCSEWIKELRNLGHKVRVLSSKENAESHFHCESAPLPFNPDVSVSIPSVQTFLEISKYAPDVIHCVSPSWPEVYVWVNFYSRITSTPIVTSHHVSLPSYNDQYWGENTVLSKLFSNLGAKAYYDNPLEFSEFICGPTRTSLEYFKKSDNYKEDKMQIFSTGINRDFFSIDKIEQDQLETISKEIEQELGVKGNKTILYAGRIAKEKNLDVFFGLAKKNPDINFVICGHGPEESRYRKLCKQDGIENVYFAGKKSQKELAHYYYFSDMMVTPSTTETFGFTVIECMSMGTPVLMPKVSVFVELHGQLEELLVSHKQDIKSTIESYNSKIDELLFSEDKEGFSKKLIEHCKNFTWKNSAQDMVSIYKKAITSYTKSPDKEIASLRDFAWMVPVSKILLPLSSLFYGKYLKNE